MKTPNDSGFNLCSSIFLLFTTTLLLHVHSAAAYISDGDRSGNLIAGPSPPAIQQKKLEGIRCLYHRDCPYGYRCSQNECWEDASNKHLAARRCIHDGQCPGGYACIQTTCMEGESVKHLEARLCLHDHDCPWGYTCKTDKYLCYEDASSKHLEARICTKDFECPSMYTCKGDTFTCFLSENANHLEQFCLVDSHCPASWKCREITCYYYP